MADLLTAAQMRAIEEAAIASGKVTGLELMERAGAGAVSAVLDTWPELSDGSHHAVVLCGPGNNGGDGFVVARLLHERGWQVDVFLYGDPNKLPPDAATNHARWSTLGPTMPLNARAVAEGTRPRLLVDAMFGTGLTRPIPLECAEAFQAVEKRKVDAAHPWHVPYDVVALDCVSGVDCDSGKWVLPAVDPTSDDDTKSEHWGKECQPRILFADLTLSFHRRKIGHCLGNASRDVRVIDIGLGTEDVHASHLLMPASPEVVRLLHFERGGRAWPHQHVSKSKSLTNHKFDYGHALVLSGDAGRTGAARLAARGALRIGAGLVTLGVPPAAQMEVASQITAIMLARVPDAGALAALLDDDRISALCVGPGLGLREDKAALIETAVNSGRPVVLDADALTHIAQRPALFDALHSGCVLTPHGGEFARLFPDIDTRLRAPASPGPAYSKVDAARDAAARSGAVVLFKGAETVIAHPDGLVSVHAARFGREAPWLAAAGAGDVLAGFITGLMCRTEVRSVAPFQAAEVAAWLHVECARAFGPGLIAEDLPEILPRVLRDLDA